MLDYESPKVRIFKRGAIPIAHLLEMLVMILHKTLIVFLMFILRGFSRPSLKERGRTAQRITNKIMSFVDTFINGVVRRG